MRGRIAGTWFVLPALLMAAPCRCLPGGPDLARAQVFSADHPVRPSWIVPPGNRV